MVEEEISTPCQVLSLSSSQYRTEFSESPPAVRPPPQPQPPLTAFALIRCSFPARELRLHLLPGPAGVLCLPHSAGVACARTPEPTRGHCSLRAIVPTSAWPRPAARRAWDWDRSTQGSEHYCVLAARSHPPGLPGKRTQ